MRHNIPHRPKDLQGAGLGTGTNTANRIKMGIYILPYSHRKGYRPCFYGKYKLNGKTHTVKLSKIRGTPPPDLKISGQGDTAFEKSRVKAEEMLKAHVEQARSKNDTAHLIRKAVELSSGQDSLDIKLADLKELNATRRRIKKPTEYEMNFQGRVLDAFAKFAKTRNVESLYEVDQKLADAYFESIRTCYAWNSVGKRIFVLSGAFKRFAPSGMKNPFAEISSSIKEGKKQFPQTPHRPLTEDQLKKLIAAAKNDELLYPLVMCAAYTGLRLGDVCTLKVSEVNLAKGIITRKTHKTNTEITAPILPELRIVLEKYVADNMDGKNYVFPKAAAIYKSDNTKICVLGKRLFATALFGDEPETIDLTPKKKLTPEDVLEAVSKTNFAQQKKQRICDNFNRFHAGQSYREIERQTGCSRGQISDDLATLEKITETQIRPIQKKTHLIDMIAKTREDGTSGAKKRSLYGWHSLRATFVVLALLRQVPLELVRRIVGHSTLDMTLKYFNPTGEHIAKAFAAATTFNQVPIDGWAKPTKQLTNSATPAIFAALFKTLTKEQRAALKAQL